jgi:hypothetical protein
MFKKMKKEGLRQIHDSAERWCVSMYLPLSRKDLQLNRSRLKKLMFEAEKKLLDLGTPIITVAKMLLPLESILDNNSFWNDQENGLAIFLTPNLFDCHSVPFEPEGVSIVSNKFYVEPLIGRKPGEIEA